MLALLCSTPFGITDLITPDPAPVERLLPVLNAFRHHRSHHRTFLSRVRIICRCSTPFGITDLITPSIPVPSYPRTCAQRPSASQISSQSIRRTHCPRCRGAQRLSASQISSPRESIRQRHTDQVLNAFRHHRSHHGRRPADSSWITCAQRLSASQISSPRGMGSRRPLLCVLNAFRHHRSHHTTWRN